MKPIPSPFPYFGGKRKVADQVWQRFGKVQNYVEPFAGSAAALFARPLPFSGNETINDVDGMVANFWRAVKLRPEKTAEHADNLVNENDLHARHAWLVGQKEALSARLEGDPEWCDPKVAGGGFGACRAGLVPGSALGAGRGALSMGSLFTWGTTAGG